VPQWGGLLVFIKNGGMTQPDGGDKTLEPIFSRARVSLIQQERECAHRRAEDSVAEWRFKES
jgi:hypothetical protein